MCALLSRGKDKVKFVPRKDRKENTDPALGFENEFEILDLNSLKSVF